MYGIGKQQTPNPLYKLAIPSTIETMEERELQQTCSDDTRLNHILQVIHEHAWGDNLSFERKMVELRYDRRIKMKPLISAYSGLWLVLLPIIPSSSACEKSNNGVLSMIRCFASNTSFPSATFRQRSVSSASVGK